MQMARIAVVLPILIVMAMGGVCLASMHDQNAARGASTRKNTTPVHVLFGVDAPESGIFPSDGFTIANDAQKTGVRVKLPLPDCNVHVSDCRDLALINVLDGFSLQPRVTVPFDGDIDPSTVNRHNAFFVELGDADLDDRRAATKTPLRA